MRKKLLPILVASTVAAFGISNFAYAQAKPPLVLGVLTDMSGIYSDSAGQGSVEAVKMAVEDFGGKVLGREIKVIFADHQNKTDVGIATLNRWYNREGVSAVFDLVFSPIAIAAYNLATEKKKFAFATDAGSSVLSNKHCSPYGFQWSWSTYTTSKGVAAALKQDGGDTWTFITADYAYGLQLEKDASEIVKKLGGKIVGSIRHPSGNTDFSGQLLQAKASKAKVIGFANGGHDFVNAAKQAQEFGITAGGQKIAALATFITDIHSMGLQTAQGLTLATAYYWDRNDESRAFGKRFFERRKAMPAFGQAGAYSAALAYLKAVQAAGTDDTDAVAAKLRATPVNDMFAKNGKVRPDGYMEHEFFLAQVKTPAESKGPWDYYKIIRTIPADQAYPPLSESECPLVKK
jgi:branched-chain amino acid transport system substrate-binding protein